MLLSSAAIASLLLHHCAMTMEATSHGFGLVELSVHGEFESFEQVFVVGSVPSLGIWKPEESVRLSRQHSSGGDIWTVRLLLPVENRIEYRLFTAFSGETSNQGSRSPIAIIRWEAFSAPRELLVPRSQSLTNITCTFGAKGDEKILKDGWLTDQYEVRLMIYGRSVRFYDSQIGSVAIRVSAASLGLSNDRNASNRNADRPSLPCYISVLTREDSLFKTCDKFVPFDSDDVLIVKRQSFMGKDLFFQLECFHAYTVVNTSSAEANAKPIGVTVLLTSAMRDNFGYSISPITNGDGMVVGEIGGTHTENRNCWQDPLISTL